MDVFEISGLQTGVSKAGVDYLQPADSFESIKNGYLYRQVLQSRKGISQLAPQLANASRIMMIQSFQKTDGTTTLLVADKNFLYKYNVGTRTFDQISFGGSMAGYGGFNITNNSGYISGTAYPDKDNNSRFVFTSPDITPNAAGSSVFFYDVANGDVRDYTAVADNAEYVPFSSGALINARHVLWYNERINFVKPTVGTVTYNQGWLYSAIKDSSGNGDNFNAAGAGLGQLDTFEVIQGASIFGQYLALNLSGSNWLLEKTTDAFNPYFPKKIPSIIGTDAPFSFAQWNSKINTVGRDGFLGMDFRESLRIDNKIPFFARDEMDANNMDLVYGGFDRDTAQFLWSYKTSESLDDDTDSTRTQDAIVTYNYEENTWATYDLSVSVFGQFEAEETLTWDQINATIKEEWAKWDTTTEIWDRIGKGDKFKLTLAGDDAGIIYQFNSDYNDYFVPISAITNASQAVVTIDASNFKVGDEVVILDVEGMTEINNNEDDPTQIIYYTVEAATSTQLTLNVDSTNYSAYTTGGYVCKPIEFEATTNPINPYREQGRKIFISSIECQINANGGFVYVDVFVDGDDDPYLENVLLQPTNATRDREYVSMTIDNEADFFTFRFKHKSITNGLQMPAIRIYAEQGGMTNG